MNDFASVADVPLSQRPALARDVTGGLLAPFELAALLEISIERLRRWRTSGEGPPFVRIAAKPFYRLRDVRQWVEALPVERPRTRVRA